MNTKHLLHYALSAMLLISCSTHDDTAGAGSSVAEPFPVQIATIETSQTQTAELTPYYGESLALTYIYPNSAYNMETGVSSDQFVRFGIKWESNDDIGIFYWEQTGERSKPMLWKGVGSSYAVNIYAYAPFIEPKTGTSLKYTELPFSIQADQSDTLGLMRSDLLGWSSQNYVPTSGQQKLTIQFRHLLSQLTVILKTGPGSTVTEEDLASAEVMVQNVQKNIVFSLYNFEPQLQQSVDDLTDINPLNESKDDNHHFRCVFPPQTIIAESNFIVVKIGDKSYTYQPVADLTFQKDTAYRLTLEVGDTRLNPVAVEVEPWGQPMVMTDDELELK